MTLNQSVKKLVKQFPGLSVADPFRDEVTVVLEDAERVAEVCIFLKSELGFDYLIDISSVDFYGDVPRFMLVYECYGMEHHHHLRLTTAVSEETEDVPSVTSVWRTADWHEREIYDMMGIRFRHHPDLRRILMWDGYPHFPLRKDFPLEGKPTDLEEVAFTRKAPLEGGPFVTSPGGEDTTEREPRFKGPAEDPSHR